jgi:hypothetical protein
LEKKYLSTHTTKEGGEKKKNLPQKLNLQKHQTETTQENTHQKCSKNNNKNNDDDDQIHKNPMRNKLAAAVAQAQLQTLQQQQQQQENQYICNQRNYKRNTKSNPNPTI